MYTNFSNFLSTNQQSEHVHKKEANPTHDHTNARLLLVVLTAMKSAAWFTLTLEVHSLVAERRGGGVVMHRSIVVCNIIP